MKKNNLLLIATGGFLIAGIFSFFSGTDYSIILGVAFIVLAIIYLILFFVKKKKPEKKLP